MPRVLHVPVSLDPGGAWGQLWNLLKADLSGNHLAPHHGLPGIHLWRVQQPIRIDVYLHDIAEKQPDLRIRDPVLKGYFLLLAK